MTAETRKDCKFYTSLFLGFGMALLGCLIPPVGVIETSVLWICFGFLMLSACIEGIDVKGIIREIRLLKQDEIKTATSDSNNKEDGGLQ